ncbi:hypothetical protein L1999_22715 [Neobacillus drentensis]|uniref:hypothetical protein n=1 Tax=Neobacillus drentensis TaxID=220684 RepID=UPI001F33225F|nr:hypothetical protein [Neobacillus drentensis]ULT55874.1 hypothetical protein L1999_22715 [Neobacillus drentensis]
MNYLTLIKTFDDIGLFYTTIGNRDDYKFIDGLIRVRSRIMYHNRNLNDVFFDSKFEQHAKKMLTDPLNANDSHEVVSDNLTKIDAELVAMMQAIRTQFDVFAQIINSELFANPIDPFIVDFKNIKKQVPDTGLCASIENIISDQNFIYLDDFVNSNKHVDLPSINGFGWSKDMEYLIEGFNVSEFKRKIRERRSSSTATTYTVNPKELLDLMVILPMWANDQLKQLSACLKLEQVKKLDSLGEWNEVIL